MDYEVSENNIQLKSSFEVSKDDLERELAAIRERHPDSLVWYLETKTKEPAYAQLSWWLRREGLAGLTSNF